MNEPQKSPERPPNAELEPLGLTLVSPCARCGTPILDVQSWVVPLLGHEPRHEHHLDCVWGLRALVDSMSGGALQPPINPRHEEVSDPEPIEVTLTQTELRDDRAAAYRLAEEHGSVTIVDDETGEPVAILGIPRDRRPSEDELLERVAELEAALAQVGTRDAVWAGLLQSARRAAEHWREEWAQMSDDDADDPDPRPPLDWEGGESLDARLTATAEEVLALTTAAPAWSARWPTKLGWYWTSYEGDRVATRLRDREVGERNGFLFTRSTFALASAPLFWGERIPEPAAPREDEGR